MLSIDFKISPIYLLTCDIFRIDECPESKIHRWGVGRDLMGGRRNSRNLERVCVERSPIDGWRKKRSN